MSPRDRSETDGIDSTTTALPRRHVLAIGAGLGVTLLAGCAGDTGSDPETGAFRLLVSDQPADIGDFDRLDVTFDSARIFEADQETTTEATNTTTESGETTTEATNATTEATDTTTDADGTTTQEATETTSGTVESTEEVAEGVRKGDGFYVLDLDDPTVDLTQVLGKDAMGVFEGELEAGSYAKIELSVSDVEGVVEGEEVAVKVPSEKLQITQPFEISAEEAVEFVFDINVVKRGPTNGYNLLPVISESGVAGRDVEYDEVPQTETTTAE
ncbi:MAG: DUF4382 domain-containing protein [Halodesulfurarchaeum sp.]